MKYYCMYKKIDTNSRLCKLVNCMNVGTIKRPLIEVFYFGDISVHSPSD